MIPHSSLIHIHSALAPTTGEDTKLMRNASLFVATTSTPDPELKETQQQIILSTFYPLKDLELSIEWKPYQSSPGAPPITALLAIARTKNDELRLRLLSCPQHNSDDPRATVSVSGLLAFTRTSDLMLPSVFTVDDIKFSKMVFSKPIHQILSALLSIGIANKQGLQTHFDNATFDAMRNVTPFCAYSTAPFESPKRTRS